MISVLDLWQSLVNVISKIEILITLRAGDKRKLLVPHWIQDSYLPDKSRAFRPFTRFISDTYPVLNSAKIDSVKRVLFGGKGRY